MTATMPTTGASKQCETVDPVLDPNQGAVMHQLARQNFSSTPGGANTKARRALGELLLVAKAATDLGEDEWLDQFFAALDELRTAGSELHLDDAAKLAIERCDAEDNAPRLAFHLNPNAETGRAAKHYNRRCIRALLESNRGIDTLLRNQ